MTDRATNTFALRTYRAQGIALGTLLLGELLLAFLLPQSGVEGVFMLKTYVDTAGKILSVVHNFDRIATYPEKVAAYIALTLPLLLPKCYIIYRWLNSDYLGTYRHLVLSPLTKFAPRSGIEYFAGGTPSAAQLTGESGNARSIFWRIAGSLIVIAMSLLLLFSLIIYGSEVADGTINTALSRTRAGYLKLARDPFWMWWELGYHYLGAALVISIDVSIVRDYFLYINNAMRGWK